MYETTINIPERLKDHPIFSKRIKGMNFGFLSKRGYYAREDILQEPKKMAEMGVNCVTLNLNICQEKYCSTRVYLDFEYSVGELEVKQMTDALHKEGIMVIFKPCMTCMDSMPMAEVTFPEMGGQIEGVRVDYWEEWFKNYRACLRYCADLCREIGMDALMIGAELLGTERKDSHWRQLIAEVRERFDGPITYEFIPVSRRNAPLLWFEELDFLSYSYYPPACPREHMEDPDNNPVYSYEEIYSFLLDRRAIIRDIHNRFGNKPILFTEHGARSVRGGIQLPANVQFDARYDGEEQANYMKASAEVFRVMPEYMGFMWWKWDETQNRPHYHKPGGDTGFTIQGKPAEKVFRELELHLPIK